MVLDPVSAVAALYGAVRAVWDALGPARDALGLADATGSLRDRLRDRRFASSVAKQARQALEGTGTPDAAAAARLLGSEVLVAFAADPDDPARRAALSDLGKQGAGLKALIGPNVDEQAAFEELAKAFVAAALAAATPAQRLIAAKLDVSEETALHVLNTAQDLHPKLDHANSQLAEVLRSLRVEIADLLVGPECEPFLAQDVDLAAFQMASDVTDGLIPPYVPRDVDPQLDELLADAAGGGIRFVAVAGRTKSGKTRCLVEALARVTPLHLVYRVRHSKQRDTIAALVDALAAEPPGQPWVILVDDLSQHLARSAGTDLTPAVRRAARIEPPGLIVATIATETVTVPKAQRLADGINDDDIQLIKIRRVTLPPATIPAEQARANHTFGPQLTQGGIVPSDLAHFPERLAAIPELLARIDHARHQLPSSSAQYALIVAATRIALAQTSRAVSREEVRDHAKCIHRHLEGHERGTLALNDDALDQAEEWAAEQVGAAYALLKPEHGADNTVEVLDAALNHLGSVAVDPRFGPCGPADPDYATRLGISAYWRFNDPTAGIYWTSQAAETSDVTAMWLLGRMLQEEGDLDGAEDWLRQGAVAGDTGAMFHLTYLLADRGDLAGAREWGRRLVGPDHGAVMRDLAGDRLKKSGDLAGAEEQWHRAADLGRAGAMHKLGVLHEEMGDLPGAADWYRRAAASEDTTVATAAADSLARLEIPPDQDVPEA
jgi:TPR repeat protein